MSYAPTDYDYGEPSNYAFAESITAANYEAKKMFVEAYGHMLNYNHEQAIACFMACTELDPKLRHGMVGHCLLCFLKLQLVAGTWFGT